MTHKNSIRQVLMFILLALVSSGVFAQKLNGKQKKALKQLKDDIGYLASDDLKGRATGSQGERLSAEYIARGFEQNKLEPLGTEGYFQKFAITTLRIANAKSEFNLNGVEMKLFSDYYPLSYSANASDLNAAIVAVGYGISSEERDDYKNVEVNDRIVAINIGSPDGIHPHSKFLAWHGISIRVDEAVKRGAKGVIFYRDKETVEKPKGELSLTMKPSSIPVLFLDRVYDKGEFLFATIKLKIMVDQDYAYNVIGFKDNGAQNTIVIGAHHDHLGQGEHGNSLAQNPNEIHNGADDNASGSAALITLSKVLKKSKKWNKENNYLFIAFSGEEMGLLGSKYFVENPTIDLSTVNYMINMDMIGMYDKEKGLIINGVGTSPSFVPALDELLKEDLMIDTVVTTFSGIGPSDHTSFYLKGIPSLHFFTGAHEHYHKPTDDIERVNYLGEIYVLDYMTRFIRTLNDDGKIVYSKTKDETNKSSGKSRSKFEVTLGVIPNYSFSGEGMQIDAVRDGKPGKEAGLMAKDVIISFAGYNIANMTDYMKALGSLKKGDSADLVVRRNGENITLKVKF